MTKNQAAAQFRAETKGVLNSMTIYIYSNETNAQVDSHTADDNSACEQWANDKYGHEDYHWSYCDQPVSNA